MMSLVVIILALLVAVFGYLISPDNTPYANRQFLELANQKPGFKVEMLRLKKNKEYQNISFLSILIHGKPDEFQWIPVYNHKQENGKLTVELFTGDTPNDGEIKVFETNNIVYPPKVFRFWFGTDSYGRDILSQLIIGTRVSLSVGMIAVLISLVLGIFMGAVAGYFRGWLDDLIMWFINVVWSIPTLLLVIAITFALGKGFWQVFIAVGLTMWVDVARIVRGQFMSLREKEFVEAGKALGFRSGRIIFRHILPNVMDAVIVISAANFASAILIEAGLSFLGIGVQPPMPSWGTMIKEHYRYIILDKAYLAILPGIAIVIMVLAFMLLGNGLRDALDVKSQDN
jgi:peptide/nickel transport system permease protein